jgi:hypothetical protein
MCGILQLATAWGPKLSPPLQLKWLQDRGRPPLMDAVLTQEPM